MEHFVEFEDVCKYYQTGSVKIAAADHLNFYVDKGEFCIIVGPSGAGKTTLLNILGGMDNCDEGNVWLDGRNVSRFSARELTTYRRYDVGFVFQFYNLVQNLTALENVELPLIYRKTEKKKRHTLAVSALEMVGLSERMNHRPFELSGGQQQRVAIARAIATEPPLILADEPTGNLDAGSSDEIMRILSELHNSGKTVVIITHDNSIAAMADKRIEISDGRII